MRNLFAKAIGGGLLLLCPFPCLGQEPERIMVKNFSIVGGTVFSPAELEAITQPFIGRPLTLTELQQVSQAITQLYIDRGYITSGAYIPAQTPQNGTVTIHIIEGSLAEIKVEGLQRLPPSYIIDRVQTPTPLNRNDLLQALQLLQLNPRIQAITSELSPSPLAGKSILEITVTEAPTSRVSLTLDNQRSPGVGEFRRQLQWQELNLSGGGDTLTLSYTNTDGSNLYELGYTLPLNPQDGTLGFHYSQSNSQVLEPPFSALDILASARTYELAYRQPLHRSPNGEFSLGIALTRSESETTLLATPFPLSPGADTEGRTKVTAVRLRQEYGRRSNQDVLALRSELSVGIQPFALNTNDIPQDSFFALWRGQAQYVQQLATSTQLIGRLNGQLASQVLVAIEQFSLGGVNSVRGYRQDFLLTDNGIYGGAEIRLPLREFPTTKGLLQLVSFLEGGVGWNNGGKVTPSISTIGGIGVGLRWQQGEGFTARLDYGIPLVDPGIKKVGLQQNGIYFSLNWQIF